MKRIRSRVLTITLFGFIGLSMTILTSWACSLWGPWQRNVQPPDLTQLSEIEFGVNNISHQYGFGWRADHERGARGGEGNFHYWDDTFASTRFSGFPVLAMRSRVEAYHDEPLGPALQGWDLPLTEILRRGYPTKMLPTWMHAHSSQRLPFVPHWPGFLLNILIYSALAWCMLFLPIHVRRTQRIRRGLCVRCKYNLAGLETCPECGTSANPRRMAP